MNGSHPLRGLSLYFTDPEVPLRSTPGFMRSPRFAGSMQCFTNFIQTFLKFAGYRSTSR